MHLHTCTCTLHAYPYPNTVSDSHSFLCVTTILLSVCMRYFLCLLSVGRQVFFSHLLEIFVCFPWRGSDPGDAVFWASSGPHSATRGLPVLVLSMGTQASISSRRYTLLEPLPCVIRFFEICWSRLHGSSPPSDAPAPSSLAAPLFCLNT